MQIDVHRTVCNGNEPKFRRIGTAARDVVNPRTFECAQEQVLKEVDARSGGSGLDRTNGACGVRPPGAPFPNNVLWKGPRRGDRVACSNNGLADQEVRRVKRVPSSSMAAWMPIWCSATRSPPQPRMAPTPAIAAAPQKPRAPPTRRAPERLQVPQTRRSRARASAEPLGPVSSTPYAERTVNRDSEFEFRAGAEIYELLAPNGAIYVMQSYAQIVDPALTESDLAGLGARLTLPTGWSYRARTLDAPLLVTTRGEATVVQDELQNTYSRYVTGG